MSKFFDLIKKHPVASLAIALGAVAVIVSGSVFIGSAISYDQYGKEYEKTKAKLLANTPQIPEEVFKDNEYVTYDDANKSATATKSSFTKTYVLTANEAEIDLDEGEPTFTT